MEEFVKDAFICSGVRGTDSAGMFVVDKERNTYYHKLAVSGTAFIENRVTKSLIDDADVKQITVCHTRKATEGKVLMDNAHPFLTKANAQGHWVLGVHNGTLTNWKTKKNGHKWDVDSEWAMNHIFENGIDAFKDFTGAYVFVWYDNRTPEVINVARNKERTLYYSFLQTGAADKKERAKTCLLSSEHGMLSWLANRNNLEIEPKIYSTEPGFLYQFNIDDVTKYTKTALPTVPVIITPTYNNNSEGGSYARPYSAYGKDNVLSAVRAALNDPAVQKAAKSEKAPKGETHVPTANVQSGMVTYEEEKDAAANRVLGDTFDFQPLKWDPVKKIMEGIIDVVVGTGIAGIVSDTLDCEFRGLNENTAKEMMDGDFSSISGKCVGLTYREVGDSVVELVYILAFPTLRLVSIPVSQGRPN